MECHLNSSNFYFIIGPTGIYIKHYLCGGAEFKAIINRIMVDFGSSSHSPPPPPSPLQLPLNHMQWPGDKPLPSCEGCGLNPQHPGMHEADNSCTHPSGMWVVQPHLTKNLGRRMAWGTGEAGVPKGELRSTSHDICCGSFSLSLFSSPSLTLGRHEAPKQQQ